MESGGVYQHYMITFVSYILHLSVFSAKKIDHYEIIEILLKGALNTHIS